MSQSHQSAADRRSPAEWTTFGIATVIVVAIAGLVAWDWLTAENQPPILTVRQTGSVRTVDGQFYIPFTVTNSGGETAESVQVVADLQLNGKEETGEQQIDFLSAGETAAGAFIFSQNPQQGKVTLRVASYKLP